MTQENTLSDYHKIDAEVRTRAKQVKLEYAARIPQASWLRLDLDGAVLLTPAEFSYLPQSSREFFLYQQSPYQKSVLSTKQVPVTPIWGLRLHYYCLQARENGESLI